MPSTLSRFNLNLHEQLASFGIITPGDAHGTFRMRCPQPACIDKRRHNLSVTVEDNHGVWFCHRCGWSGSTINHITKIEPRAAIKFGNSARDTRQLARALWDRCIPAPGTVVDEYLWDRGITWAVPPAIRCHPGLAYRVDGKVVGAWPAMVTRLDDENGDFCGVSRCWLGGDIFPNAVGKAPVPEPRKILGHAGVAWLGPRDAQAICIGEGVETTLRAVEMPTSREAEMWGDDQPEPWGVTPVAAISATGMRKFTPPPTCRRLFICEDDDPEGREAASALVARCRTLGVRAFLLREAA